MPADIATEAWLVFLLSLVFSALALPVVFVFSFIYSYLGLRSPKTPKILLMAAVTFLAVVCVVVLLEIYVGYTIGDVASQLAQKS